VLATLALNAVLAAVLAAVPGTARRGNDAIARAKGPVFSVAAAPRIGVLLAGGAQAIQRVGFGAGLQFRVHALRLGPLRIGAGVQLGHTRFLERYTVAVTDGGTARRWAALGHTDFAAGPSFQIVMGPVFAELGVEGGLGISSLVRPLGPTVAEETETNDTTGMIRGGGHLGVPIRNNSSVTIGASVHKYFSRARVVARPDPNDPDAMPDVNPFDLMLELTVGYHFMF